MKSEEEKPEHTHTHTHSEGKSRGPLDDPDFLRLLEAEPHMLLNENKIIKQLRFNEVSSCESADNKPTRWNQNPSHDDTLAAPIFIYFFYVYGLLGGQ